MKLKITRQKRLCRIGNSLGVVIDAAWLELMGVDRETTLQATFDGGRIVIQPAEPHLAGIRRARRALSQLEQQVQRASGEPQKQCSLPANEKPRAAAEDEDPLVALLGE